MTRKRARKKIEQAISQTAEPEHRPVLAVARVLIGAPSLGPVCKAWAKLGFTLGEEHEFVGCRAVDLPLRDVTLTFVCPQGEQDAESLSAAVSRRLVAGSGVLGWTWSCADVEHSRRLIERRTGERFPAACGRLRPVPAASTPAAVTLLEDAAAIDFRPHPNHVTGLDHVVVAVDDVVETARTYERGFGLKARIAELPERPERRYAFLKVGPSLIEIVGPPEPPARPEGVAPSGQPWGLALRSDDLDATVETMRTAGVEIGDPHAAVQGGRITGLGAPLGGVHIAFMGN